MYWGGNANVLLKKFSKVYLNFHDMLSSLVIADSKLLNTGHTLVRVEFSVVKKEKTVQKLTGL